MLLILVLEQLTHLSKGLGALGTLVWKVRDALIIVPITIGQLRDISHVSRHALLGLRVLVDLLPSIVLTSTARTEPALHMSDGVGSRLFETGISAHGTSDIAGTMHLHVHIKVVLALERTVADAALVGRRRCVRDAVDAIFAPRPSFAFCPLVPVMVYCWVSLPLYLGKSIVEVTGAMRHRVMATTLLLTRASSW